jgi:hypothetical protein
MVGSLCRPIPLEVGMGLMVAPLPSKDYAGNDSRLVRFVFLLTSIKRIRSGGAFDAARSATGVLLNERASVCKFGAWAALFDGRGETGNRFRLAHAAVLQACPLCVSGLIGPGDRKDIQPMAEHLWVATMISCATSLQTGCDAATSGPFLGCLS